MKPFNHLPSIKIEFAFWLGFRAAMHCDDESEAFSRLKGAASEYDLLRLFLETSEVYRDLPAREAWRKFRQTAFADQERRTFGRPSWTEVLRAMIAEGGAV